MANNLSKTDRESAIEQLDMLEADVDSLKGLVGELRDSVARDSDDFAVAGRFNSLKIGLDIVSGGYAGLRGDLSMILDSGDLSEAVEERIRAAKDDPGRRADCEADVVDAIKGRYWCLVDGHMRIVIRATPSPRRFICHPVCYLTDDSGRERTVFWDVAVSELFDRFGKGCHVYVGGEDL